MEGIKTRSYIMIGSGAALFVAATIGAIVLFIKRKKAAVATSSGTSQQNTPDTRYWILLVCLFLCALSLIIAGAYSQYLLKTHTFG